MSEAAEMAMKIGDLLLRSGLATVEQMEEAVKVADKMQLSLQRVMEMNAWVSDRAFKARCRCRQTHFFPSGFSDSQVAKLLGVQADRLAFPLREEAWMASRARCQSSFESFESPAKVLGAAR